MQTSEERQQTQSSGLAGASTKPKGLLKRISPQSRYYWIRLLLENPVAVASMLFILLLLVLTFTVPSMSDQDIFRLNPADRLQDPFGEFWLGSDQLGRDVLVRAIYGVRVSLAVGGSIMVVSALLGTVLGLIAGYYNRVDTPIMRVMDGIMAFPPILLAIAIMASLGQSAVNVVIALGVVYIPIMSRLVRGQTLSIKQQPYVEAAKSIGARDYLILGRHIFPNSLSPLIVQGTFIIALAIIAEASLSFLGAGVDPETPTWGSMLRDGQEVITRAWWLVVVPGAFLFFTVLALNLVGDALRDAMDPRARGR